MSTNLPEIDVRNIVIEGPIGVGKTTLARALSLELGARLVLEPADENPFLSKFYADPRKHAFQTQLFFMLTRFKQQEDLNQGDLFAKGTVCDYLFARDRIFAALNLEEAEFALYERIYTLLHTRVPHPNLVVYLQARPDVLMERMRRRNPDGNVGLSYTYLEKLSQAYHQFFFRYDESALLVVNTNDIDLEKSQSDREGLIREIRNIQRGIHHYIPVAS